jgi:hypothetical protein
MNADELTIRIKQIENIDLKINGIIQTQTKIEYMLYALLEENPSAREKFEKLYAMVGGA